MLNLLMLIFVVVVAAVVLLVFGADWSSLCQCFSSPGAKLGQAESWRIV